MMNTVAKVGGWEMGAKALGKLREPDARVWLKSFGRIGLFGRLPEW